MSPADLFVDVVRDGSVAFVDEVLMDQRGSDRRVAHARAASAPGASRQSRTGCAGVAEVVNVHVRKGPLDVA